MNDEYRYFSSVRGRLFRRNSTYLGAYRGGSDGIDWDTDLVVRVPKAEITRDLKTWNNALRHGDVVERSRREYDTYHSRATNESDRSDSESAGALDTASGRDPVVGEAIPRRGRRKKT